jgi:hypothetical protein
MAFNKKWGESRYVTLQQLTSKGLKGEGLYKMFYERTFEGLLEKYHKREVVIIRSHPYR